MAKNKTNLAAEWWLVYETDGRGIGATHSNADFAKDLLWDLACFLKRLVQGATILQPAGKKNMRERIYWKDCLKYNTSKQNEFISRLMKTQQL